MNIVITFATGYTPLTIEPFLRSAKKNLPDAAIILFVNELGPADSNKLQAMNPRVKLIEVPRRTLWRDFANSCFKNQSWYQARCRRLWHEGKLHHAEILHIAFARFFLVREYMVSAKGSIDKIVFTDCRDVVIQADPFPYITDTLISGLEDAAIQDEPYNRRWILQLYGQAELDQLRSQTICCSGVTMGPYEVMLGYMNAMCNEIERKLLTCIREKPCDQGIHNYLLRNNLLPPIRTVSNGAPEIATLGISEMGQFTVSDQDGLLTGSGVKAAVVHQYDRKPELTALFKRLYTRS